MKRLSGVNLHQLQNDFASQSVEFAEIALCLILSAEVRGTAHAAYKKLVAWRKHEWEILENLAQIYSPRLRIFYKLLKTFHIRTFYIQLNVGTDDMAVTPYILIQKIFQLICCKCLA